MKLFKAKQTITYTKYFRFGKSSEITAKIVAVKEKNAFSKQYKQEILTDEGDTIINTISGFYIAN